VLLGRYGTPDGRAEYLRQIQEWEAAARRLRDKSGSGAFGRTVIEVLLAFTCDADQHYRRADGTPTEEIKKIMCALRAVKEMYGHTLARDFGRLALRVIRERMIAQGLARTLINSRIGIVRRAFK